MSFSSSDPVDDEQLATAVSNILIGDRKLVHGIMEQEPPNEEVLDEFLLDDNYNPEEGIYGQQTDEAKEYSPNFVNDDDAYAPPLTATELQQPESAAAGMMNGVDKWHNYAGIAPSWRLMNENHTLWDLSVPSYSAHTGTCPFYVEGYTANILRVDTQATRVPTETTEAPKPVAEEEEEAKTAPPEKFTHHLIHVNEEYPVCTCDLQLTPRQQTLFDYIKRSSLIPTPSDMFIVAGFTKKWGLTTTFVSSVAYLMCEIESVVNITIPNKQNTVLDIDVFVKDEDRVIDFMDKLVTRLKTQSGRAVIVSLEKTFVSIKHAQSNVHVICKVHQHSLLKRVSYIPSTYVFVDDAFEHHSDNMPPLTHFIARHAYRASERSTDPTKSANDLRRFIVGGTCETSAMRGDYMSNWCNLRNLTIVTKKAQEDDMRRIAKEDYIAKMKEAEKFIKQNNNNGDQDTDSKQTDEEVSEEQIKARERKKLKRVMFEPPQPRTLTPQEERQMERASQRNVQERQREMEEEKKKLVSGTY